MNECKVQAAKKRPPFLTGAYVKILPASLNLPQQLLHSLLIYFLISSCFSINLHSRRLFSVQNFHSHHQHCIPKTEKPVPFPHCRLIGPQHMFPAR